MRAQGRHQLRAMVLAASVAVMAGAAWAKLPPPSDEAKAKGEEAKVKAAEAAKKGAEDLTKSQDQVAAHYIKNMKAKGVTVKPTPIAPPAAVPAAAPAPAAKK